MCLLAWAVYKCPPSLPSPGFTHFNGLLSDDFKRSSHPSPCYSGYASVCLALILILISACGFRWPEESFAVACPLACDLCSPPPVLRLCLLSLYCSHMITGQRPPSAYTAAATGLGTLSGFHLDAIKKGKREREWERGGGGESGTTATWTWSQGSSLYQIPANMCSSPLPPSPLLVRRHCLSFGFSLSLSLTQPHSVVSAHVL